MIIFANLFIDLAITVQINNNIRNHKTETITAIRKAKKEIPMYTGISLLGKQFETGKMTVLRRSLQDVFEHALDNEVILIWLQSFDIQSLLKMKYKGRAPNRPFPIDHPFYDPNNPNKLKHEHDTDYFLYYTIKINSRNYWVNVKMHRDYGEVIYAIEKMKPHDLIKGHKKSDIENVYSFLLGIWRESHQYHVANIQQKTYFAIHLKNFFKKSPYLIPLIMRGHQRNEENKGDQHHGTGNKIGGGKGKMLRQHTSRKDSDAES